MNKVDNRKFMVLNLLRKITNKIMDKLKNKKNKNYKKKDKLQNQN